MIRLSGDEARGRALRTARVALGMTEAEMAEAAGLTVRELELAEGGAPPSGSERALRDALDRRGAMLAVGEDAFNVVVRWRRKREGSDE